LALFCCAASAPALSAVAKGLVVTAAKRIKEKFRIVTK